MFLRPSADRPRSSARNLWGISIGSRRGSQRVSQRYADGVFTNVSALISGSSVPVSEKTSRYGILYGLHVKDYSQFL